MPPSQEFDAVFLRSVDYAEKDRIVTLLGVGVGKLTVFARGARASRKRFPSGLELFCRYRVSLGRGRGSLPTLSSAEAQKALPDMTVPLERLAMASCALEVTREVLHESEPQDEVFGLLWAFLDRLHSLPAEGVPLMRLALVWFELQLLASQGMCPELTACARCETPLEECIGLTFVVPNGVLCKPCAEDADQAVDVDSALVRGLQRLLVVPLDDVLTGAMARTRERGEAQLVAFTRLASRITRQLLQDACPKRLKTYEFLDSLVRVGAP